MKAEKILNQLIKDFNNCREYWDIQKVEKTFYKNFWIFGKYYEPIVWGDKIMRLKTIKLEREIVQKMRILRYKRINYIY